MLNTILKQSTVVANHFVTSIDLNLMDPYGSISIDLIRNQDDLGQLELFNALAAQAVYTGVITLPTSTANVGTFSGFVQSLSTDVAADGAVMGTCTIRITGAVAWT